MADQLDGLLDLDARQKNVAAQALWAAADAIETTATTVKHCRYTEHDLYDADAPGYLRGMAAGLSPCYAQLLDDPWAADSRG